MPQPWKDSNTEKTEGAGKEDEGKDDFEKNMTEYILYHLSDKMYNKLIVDLDTADDVLQLSSFPSEESHPSSRNK